MRTGDASLEAATALRQSLSRLTRRLRLERHDRALSLGKLSVLGHLHRDGALTPSALAQAEAVQPQSLTRLLADLEVAGLALRRQDPRDGRQYLIEITPDGRETLRRDARAQAAWLADAIAAQLNSTELEVLRLAAGLMDRLAELPASPRAADSGGDAPGDTAWPE